MTIRILESAQEDLFSGFLFYEEQQVGIGDYFLNTLMIEIDSLAQHSGVHPIRSGYHRKLCDTFPFAIYYRIDNGEVVVRAVLDCRQDPDWIRDQLK